MTVCRSHGYRGSAVILCEYVILLILDSKHYAVLASFIVFAGVRLSGEAQLVLVCLI
jgi:hypothetical protein